MLKKLRQSAISTVRRYGFLTPSHGTDLFWDINRHLRNESFSVLFDVGASEGQTAVSVASIFPNAVVYSFEPIPDTYKRLCAAVVGLNVRTYNFGLGSKADTILFDTSSDRDVQFRISELGTIKADIQSLDEFCAAEAISHIDFLKIDTEGYDLEVLKGADAMLREHRINLVLTECSVNSANTFHVPFHVIHSHMEERRYRLFGIYEQIMEWRSGDPFLRRVNAAFISPSVVERNRFAPKVIAASPSENAPARLETEPRNPA